MFRTHKRAGPSNLYPLVWQCPSSNHPLIDQVRPLSTADPSVSAGKSLASDFAVVPAGPADPSSIFSNKGMNLQKEQYEQMVACFPKQRKPAKISNLDVLLAALCVVGNVCKWRSLPKEYGDWHMIYVRINRWTKKGF